jgi:hypothetical protein
VTRWLRNNPNDGPTRRIFSVLNRCFDDIESNLSALKEMSTHGRTSSFRRQEPEKGHPPLPKAAVFGEFFLFSLAENFNPYPDHWPFLESGVDARLKVICNHQKEESGIETLLGMFGHSEPKETNCSDQIVITGTCCYRRLSQSSGLSCLS